MIARNPMTAFWDASAIVPLCVPGMGRRSGRELLRRENPVVWWGASVEVASALARLEREGALAGAMAQAAWHRLDTLRSAWREVQPTSELRELAQDQLRVHALRAGDALQLAAALVWCKQRPRRRPFVCLDRRLREAAERTGFEALEF